MWDTSPKDQTPSRLAQPVSMWAAAMVAWASELELVSEPDSESVLVPGAVSGLESALVSAQVQVVWAQVPVSVALALVVLVPVAASGPEQAVSVWVLASVPAWAPVSASWAQVPGLASVWVSAQVALDAVPVPGLAVVSGLAVVAAEALPPGLPVSAPRLRRFPPCG